jgi:hypothetical protein
VNEGVSVVVTIASEVEHLTPEWLTSALGEGGVEAEVAAVSSSRIGEGVGFIGQIHRLGITYADPAAAGQPESQQWCLLLEDLHAYQPGDQLVPRNQRDTEMLVRAMARLQFRAAGRTAPGREVLIAQMRGIGLFFTVLGVLSLSMLDPANARGEEFFLSMWKRGLDLAQRIDLRPALP